MNPMGRLLSRSLLLLLLLLVLLVLFVLDHSRQFIIVPTSRVDPKPQKHASENLSSSVGNEMIPSVDRGHWIGNIWLPSNGGYLFRIQEIQKVFSNENNVWIGEVESAWTLAEILQSNGTASVQQLDEPPASVDWRRRIHHPTRSNTSLENENATAATTLSPMTCQIDPQVHHCTEKMQVLEHNCLGEVSAFLTRELDGTSKVTLNATILVLALGLWEVDVPTVCDTKSRLDSIEARVQQVVHLLQQLSDLRPQLVIVWRTTGFSTQRTQKQVKRLNQMVLQEISATAVNKIHVIDWGRTMEPRSFGKERMDGGMPSLYNVDGRAIFVQQLTNLVLFLHNSL